MIHSALDDPLIGPFWQAAAAHRLALPWCRACNQAVWYPQLSCPACQGRLDWRTLSGRARLVSWTVVRKPLSPLFEVPYVPALVAPVEAPHVHLVTQLTACQPDALRCDQPMQVVFGELRPHRGTAFIAPCFAPA